MKTQAPFIDLMPELQALAGQNSHLSPQEVARKFLLEESARRGGVEIIVATDRNGKFLGAGTQNSSYSISFPPSISHLLNDPNANLIVHHNHPPVEQQFFSDREDMGSLAKHSGIEWLLLHTENGYSAMRATDRMFQPDATGTSPKNRLISAYEKARGVAGREAFYRPEVTGDNVADVAAELGLRALREAGAIDYHSNIQTGLSHDHERSIIEQTRIQSSTPGNPVWRTAEEVVGTSPSIRVTARVNEPINPTDPPPVTLEFNRFVDFLSRRDLVASPSRRSDRSGHTELPDTGGESSGLASPSPSRRSVLETRLKPSRPLPA